MKKLLAIFVLTMIALTGCKLDGDTGGVGGEGQQGSQGEQGSQGSQGSQGEHGDQGDQGSQGETGPTGDVGPQGEQGDAGQPGADGQDAGQCLIGVYIAGSYIMIDASVGKDTDEATFMHSPLLILEVKYKESRGRYLKVVDTINWKVFYIHSDENGTIELPYVGSCLGLPPIEPEIEV